MRNSRGGEWACPSPILEKIKKRGRESGDVQEGRGRSFVYAAEARALFTNCLRGARAGGVFGAKTNE